MWLYLANIVYFCAFFSESDKDTTAANLQKRTYKPSLNTFEQDICESMNIEYKPREKKGFVY